MALIGVSRPGDEKIPTVLVLRALGLGDLLTGVPALRGVRRAFPSHRIVLAAPAPLAPIAELTDAVDELVPATGLDALRWDRSPPGVAVNLHGRGPQSDVVLMATSPQRLVAFACPQAGVEGPQWDEHEHERERWCRLVRSELAVPCEPTDVHLRAPGARSPAPGAVLVHPGAAFGSRRWPAERFARVAAQLARTFQVVVTGSPDERDLGLEVAHRAELPTSAVLAGRTSLPELAALVGESRLLVSGDTGVAHLAYAYRTPSVVLFGPVSPARWGPPAKVGHLVIAHGRGDGDPFADVPDPALLRVDEHEVLRATAQLLTAL